MAGYTAIKRLSDLIVLPHSVFALPFALAALAIANSFGPTASVNTHPVIVLSAVVVAVVAARTAAMAFNRIVDRRIDARNPRTASRELPTGAVSVRTASALVAAGSVLFVLCSGALGLHCLVLSPIVLFVLFGYSYSKRFTSYSHFVLGLALALAAGGAWWSIRPEIELTPALLMFSVMCWVAGFDIIYSCQDTEFDKKERLYSFPARFGNAQALRFARMLHGAAFIGFMLVGCSAGLGRWYYAGVLIIGLLLIDQHRVVRADDLTRVNRAFFTTNGVISLAYLVLVLLTL